MSELGTRGEEVSKSQASGLPIEQSYAVMSKGSTHHKNRRKVFLGGSDREEDEGVSPRGN